MQISHSRIDQFEKCPFKYKLYYLDKLRTIPDDSPSNALYLGTALHTGIEKDVATAVQEYYNQYPIITDQHINEAMKLEKLIPMANALLPRDGKHELSLICSDFIGYIDYLVEVDKGVYDLYDFKYSNNIDHYMESAQLHIYKYFYERLNPTRKIRNLYYLFVPKTFIRQKKTEELYQFRQRLKSELDKLEPKVVQVDYQPDKVIEFLLNVKGVLEAKEYKKNETKLCGYCDYQKYCKEGIDYMIKLPSVERRNIEKVTKKVIWVYGAPFSGKTWFANDFPNPLMLNTDGNFKFVDAPYIHLKDEITFEGRLKKVKFAWSMFKEVIDELEKKENEFKTLVLDLTEDMYEHCRLYMYDTLGITHESDDSFRAWDKVRIEYLSTMRRFFALDYENIVIISHEDSSKDLTKKTGDKITSIKPNLNDKVANKLAGMVDIVARATSDDETGKHTLSFKTSEVIFGGGRLTVESKEVPNTYEAFLGVYETANKDKKPKKEANDSEKMKPEVTEEKGSEEEKKEDTSTETEAAPRKSRPRKARK